MGYNKEEINKNYRIVLNNNFYGYFFLQYRKRCWWSLFLIPIWVDCKNDDNSVMFYPTLSESRERLWYYISKKERKKLPILYYPAVE